MSELRFAHDSNSRDYLAEGGDGEYYVSHFEDHFVSAAWTCDDDGLKRLLGVLGSAVESGKATIEAILSGDRIVDAVVETSELEGFIAFFAEELKSVTLRVPDRLFVWSRKTVSNESANTRLGEIAIITGVFDTKVIKTAIEGSASSAIGRNALELVSYRAQG